MPAGNVYNTCMEKNIISIYPANIPTEALLSALHIDREDEQFEAIEGMRREAAEIAKPIALYSRFSPELREGAVWINGVQFKEPFVYEKLSGSGSAVPYVASCGREIEAWSRRFTDMFEQFAASTLKQLCLNLIREKLFAEIREKYFDANAHVSRLNPDSLKEWPITGQIPLFTALGGVTGDIGVELAESLLMAPVKSVSGIMFQGEEPYENCQLCPKPNCPNRRAPYAA